MATLRGRGWAVTLSSFMHSFLVDGICFSFGTFLNHFLEYFGGSIWKTQLLSSIISGTYLCMGLVSGALINRFGYRRLVITGSVIASVGLFLSTFSPNLDVMILLYGVVSGIGFGLVYTPSVVIVGHYFSKRRALATGIAVCGSGIGGIVFAPLSVLLLKTYDWKGALWILSAVTLNGVIFAASYGPLPSRKCSKLDSPTAMKIKARNKSQSKQFVRVLKQTFKWSLLTSPTFALYSISGVLVCIGFYIPFNFLPVYASDLDISASEGALLISVMGIFNTVSRVLVGLLTDQSWADCIIINGTMLFIGGITTCCVPLYTTYSILMVYSALFGATAGTFVVLKSIILVEIKGVKWLSNTLGFVNFILSICVFIGSPIAGALSDLTESYDAAFYFAGGTIGLAGLMCFPMRCIARWEQNTTKTGTTPQSNGDQAWNNSTVYWRPRPEQLHGLLATKTRTTLLSTGDQDQNNSTVYWRPRPELHGLLTTKTRTTPRSTGDQDQNNSMVYNEQNRVEVCVKKRNH
ncbi:monocarboxylate transporter 12-like [Ylistrum balloti]|uniref:monocarboxylate transporter 12-like n=1 Tax=Ylistrum balloti TaxID=509963 RepID=UPI002905B493|nr:monocarboxylate transporter 12-like [Ylistrum balloti]